MLYKILYNVSNKKKCISDFDKIVIRLISKNITIAEYIIVVESHNKTSY